MMNASCPECASDMMYVRPVPRGLITSCDRDAAQIGSGIFRCQRHGEYRVYTTGRTERVVSRMLNDL